MKNYSALANQLREIAKFETLDLLDQETLRDIADTIDKSSISVPSNVDINHATEAIVTACEFSDNVTQPELDFIINVLNKIK